MSSDFFIFHTDGKRYIFHGPSCLIFDISAQQYNCLELNESIEGKQVVLNIIENSISKHKKKIRYDKNNPSFVPSCVVLNVSGKCNLACKYCFSQDKNGFKFNSMSVDECIDAISFMIKSNQEENNFTVGFFGGEPMLEENVVKAVIEECSSLFPNKNISYSITTNGTLISDDFIPIIQKHNISLLLSFDGPESIVNSSRPHKNKKVNTYSAILNTVSSLRKNKIPFSFRATVIASDCRLMETIREFEKHKVPYYLVPCFNSRNENSSVYSEWNPSALSRFLKEYDQAINYFYDRIANNKPVYCYSFIEKIKEISKQFISRHSCGIGVSLFSVISGGSIFPCMNMATRPETAIGNIYSGIEDSKRQKFLPFDIEEQPKCQSCLIRYQCSGGCFSERYDSLSNRIQDPDFEMCELKTAMWKMEIQAFQRIKNNHPTFLDNLPATDNIE